MTPLEQYLSDRNDARTAWRVKCLDMARGLPGSFQTWLERKIWDGKSRHMRVMGHSFQFHQRQDGGWTLRKRDKVLASGVGLGDLVGRIERPVTIVATGPSSRDHCWDNIRREDRFIVAVNGAPTFLKELGLVPDLFVVTDPYFVVSGRQHFLNSPQVPLVTTCRAASMLALHSPDQFTGRPFSIIERVNLWYGHPSLSLEQLYSLNTASGSPFHFPENEGLKLKVGWSERPDLGFFSGCTVVFAALQVLIGLGANDIEIVGMDLSGQGRVYEEGPDPRPTSLQSNYQKHILPSFEIMHQAIGGSGIRIRNHSPVCPLPPHLFAPL